MEYYNYHFNLSIFQVKFLFFSTQISILNPLTFRQIVGIPIGTNCVRIVANLLVFCYEKDIKLYLSDNNQADTIR